MTIALETLLELATEKGFREGYTIGREHGEATELRKHSQFAERERFVRRANETVVRDLATHMDSFKRAAAPPPAPVEQQKTRERPIYVSALDLRTLADKFVKGSMPPNDETRKRVVSSLLMFVETSLHETGLVDEPALPKMGPEMEHLATLAERWQQAKRVDSVSMAAGAQGALNSVSNARGTFTEALKNAQHDCIADAFVLLLRYQRRALRALLNEAPEKK